jgi:hypothetical protein
MNDNLDFEQIRILARNLMGIAQDDELVSWAVSRLLLGSESLSVKILAGLQPPTDHFEVRKYFERALIEVGISHENHEVLERYVKSLAVLRLQRKITSREIVSAMAEVMRFTDDFERYRAWFDFDEFLMTTTSWDHEILKSTSTQNVVNLWTQKTQMTNNCVNRTR